MLRKRCLFLLNIYNNFCKKVLNICYLASLNKIRFLLYLFGDILTSNTNPRLGSCQGSYFLTHQSKMSMLLKTAYRPRAVIRYAQNRRLENHLTTSRLGSCQVNFDSSMTVQSYARQLIILTNWTTALGL
jgi:hypothetical protein